MTIRTRRPYMFHEELHSKVDSLGSDASWVCIMLLAEGVEPFTDQLKGIERPAGFETLLDAGIIRSAGRPESYEFNPAWVRRGDYDTVMQAAELAWQCMTIRMRRPPRSSEQWARCVPCWPIGEANIALCIAMPSYFPSADDAKRLRLSFIRRSQPF